MACKINEYINKLEKSFPDINDRLKNIGTEVNQKDMNNAEEVIQQAKKITAKKQKKAGPPWEAKAANGIIWVQRVSPAQLGPLSKAGQDFSLIENFGNPFAVNGVKSHLEMEVPLGNAKEVSLMYYNWLKDGIIPIGYPKEQIENLTLRKNYILKNIDKVKNAKELWYWRTPDNKITHVDALVAIANGAKIHTKSTENNLPNIQDSLDSKGTSAKQKDISDVEDLFKKLYEDVPDEDMFRDNDEGADIFLKWLDNNKDLKKFLKTKGLSLHDIDIDSIIELGPDPDSFDYLRVLENNLKNRLNSKQEIPKKESQTKPAELKWLKGRNIIVDTKGSPKVQVNTLEDLISLANEFHKMMIDKHAPGSKNYTKHIEWFKEIFSDLDKKGIKFQPVEIEFTDTVQDDSLGRQEHSSGKEKIKLNTNKLTPAYPLKVVLHEYAHAITLSKLDKYPALKKKTKALMDRVKKELKGIDTNPNTAYAFTDEKEFLAEVISNPQLQTELDKLDSTDKGYVEQIKKIFKALLARITKKDATALTDALNIVVELNNQTKSVKSTTSIKPVIKTPNPGTKKYELFKGVYANGAQEDAIDNIKKWYKSNTTDNTYLLKGRGGTGKTTIVNKVLSELGLREDQVSFATPTNKSKVVIETANKGTKFEKSTYTTVAALLNYTSKIKNGIEIYVKNKYPSMSPEAKLRDIRILVIDETSMLTSSIKKELEDTCKKTETKILYMGDNVQLPPVNDIVNGKQVKESQVFTEHMKQNVSVLEDRMRQGEESSILPITDAIAEAVENKTNLKLDLSKEALGNDVEYINSPVTEELIDKFINAYKKDPKGTRWIMFNNQQHANGKKVVSQIRNRVYGSEASKHDFVEGEQVYVGDNFSVIGENGSLIELYNGMEAELSNVEYNQNFTTTYGNKKIGKHIVVLPVMVGDLVDNITGKIFPGVPIATKETELALKEAINAGSAKGHGNAPYALNHKVLRNTTFAGVINAHKSQGSTYNEVFVDVGNVLSQVNRDADSAYKALYVATSRPKNKLIMFNVPKSIINNTSSTTESPTIEAYYKDETATMTLREKKKHEEQMANKIAKEGC